MSELSFYPDMLFLLKKSILKRIQVFRSKFYTPAKVRLLPGVFFTNGTIEFDAKGIGCSNKNLLGIAFHAQDNSVYDAIYFKPYEYRPDGYERGAHAVAYAAHPFGGLKKWRASKSVQYEKPICSAPNDDGWFHVKVRVTKSKVQVYINQQQNAILEVSKLNHFESGYVGLFAGNGSNNRFANVVIHKAE